MTEKCLAKIDPDIIDFIATNKVATVCGCTDNKPHCFNCFYSVLDEEACLVFKSSGTTRHMQIFSDNNAVAGTVISQEISLAKIEGIQFGGVVTMNDPGLKASRSYYARFPFAFAMPGKIWLIRLDYVKYTNTTNGIKHKAEWTRP